MSTNHPYSPITATRHTSPEHTHDDPIEHFAHKVLPKLKEVGSHFDVTLLRDVWMQCGRDTERAVHHVKRLVLNSGSKHDEDRPNWTPTSPTSPRLKGGESKSSSSPDIQRRRGVTSPANELHSVRSSRGALFSRKAQITDSNSSSIASSSSTATPPTRGRGSGRGGIHGRGIAVAGRSLNKQRSFTASGRTTSGLLRSPRGVTQRSSNTDTQQQQTPTHSNTAKHTSTPGSNATTPMRVSKLPTLPSPSPSPPVRKTQQRSPRGVGDTGAQADERAQQISERAHVQRNARSALTASKVARTNAADISLELLVDNMRCRALAYDSFSNCTPKIERLWDTDEESGRVSLRYGKTFFADDDDETAGPVDCLFVPATSCFPDGSASGFEGRVARQFEEVWPVVQAVIRHEFLGELVPGTAFLVPCGDTPAGKLTRYVLYACVCRVTGGNISVDMYYGAIRSALLQVYAHNLHSRSRDNIRVIQCPSFVSNTQPEPFLNALAFAYANFLSHREQIDNDGSRDSNANLRIFQRHNAARQLQQQINSLSRTSTSNKAHFRDVVAAGHIPMRGLCNEEELRLLVAWSCQYENEWLQLKAIEALVHLAIRSDGDMLGAAVSESSSGTGQIGDPQVTRHAILHNTQCIEAVMRLCVRKTVRTYRLLSRDEFELLEIVGRGAFGKVWKAVWKTHNDVVVALKEFDYEIFKVDEDLQKDFLREVSVMSLLSHECLVDIHGACCEGGNVFIVTPFFERGDLRTLINDKSVTFTWPKIHRLLLSGAQGMQYLHDCSVLHRDLKSPNLLVTDDFRLCVADYGSSRVLTKKADTLTQGTGTPSWMSNEVFSNQAYGKPTDVYSFGIIMWECLTRDEPFKNIPHLALANHVLQGNRPPLPAKDQWYPGVPLELKKLIKSCWGPKPAKRPTFVEIVSVLSRLAPS